MLFCPMSSLCRLLSNHKLINNSCGIIRREKGERLPDRQQKTECLHVGKNSTGECLSKSLSGVWMWQVISLPGEILFSEHRKLDISQVDFQPRCNHR